MVSSTLCPAVHILGSQNVYDRVEGIANHYWPWAVFLVDPKRLCKSVRLSVVLLQKLLLFCILDATFAM